MKQIWITGTGGPEKLQVREAPDPSPGDHELRIRVKAAGSNFADAENWIGKDVIALTRFGGYSDAVIAPIERIFERPASLLTPA